MSETSSCVTSSGLSFSPALWFQAGLGLQQSSWVSVLSAGLQIWVTKASKQTHALWAPFCYIAPLIQVSSDGFLVSAVSLNSALQAFEAGAASPTGFPQPGRMAGRLLHPLGQGPVHPSSTTPFKYISEVIQSQLQGHSSLRSCFPSPRSPEALSRQHLTWHLIIYAYVT